MRVLSTRNSYFSILLTRECNGVASTCIMNKSFDFTGPSVYFPFCGAGKHESEDDFEHGHQGSALPRLFKAGLALNLS